MDLTKKLHRILPLSAASIALLQSEFSSKADIPQTASLDSGNGNGAITSKTENLTLAPAFQEQLLQMYAQHSSHASHASHASHYSGAGGGYVAPDYVTPTYPATAPATPAPVQPRPTPAAPRPVSSASGLNTNAAATTDTAPKVSPEQDAANMELLKKKAAAGSSDAQLELSIYYRYGGHGLTKSEEKADLLLEMSASQGNFGAQNLMKQKAEADKAAKLEKDSPSSDTEKSSATP